MHIFVSPEKWPLKRCVCVCVPIATVHMGFPPHFTYMQSFNFRPTVFSEISLDEKSVTMQSSIQSAMQLAQFDIPEPQAALKNDKNIAQLSKQINTTVS